MLKEIIELDKKVFLFLNNLGNTSFDIFWIFISNQIWMFCLLAPVILYFYYKQDGFQLIYSLPILLVCFGLTDLIHVHAFKNIFMRLRPCWDPDVAPLSRIVIDKGGLYGFVSGHAANSASIITFMFLYLRSINLFVKSILFFWVCIVAYSRIYLGKHYPLDVLCGALLGVFIAYLVYQIYKYYKLRK